MIIFFQCCSSWNLLRCNMDWGMAITLAIGTTPLNSQFAFRFFWQYFLNCLISFHTLSNKSLHLLSVPVILIYRRYCTARLRRLYKSLKFTHGRSKYTRKAITESTVTEVRSVLPHHMKFTCFKCLTFPFIIVIVIQITHKLKF